MLLGQDLCFLHEASPHLQELITPPLDLRRPQQPFILLLQLVWLVPADSSSVAPSWSFSHTGIEDKAVIAVGLVYSTLVSKCAFFCSFPLILLLFVCLGVTETGCQAGLELTGSLRLASNLEQLYSLQLPRAGIQSCSSSRLF